MRIQGEFLFDEPRELVWQSLLDPLTIAKVVPGCETLTQVGDHEYEGLISVGVGPVQGRFEARFALSGLVSQEGYTLKIHGKGPAGFVEGDGNVRLEDQDFGTRMLYDVEARVGGRIASVGQRLLDSSAKLIVRQGLERLKKEVSSSLADVPTGQEDSATDEGSIPRLNSRWILAACVFVVILLIIWLTN